MADKSQIEWTAATWNVINGCSFQSPGCRGCYAADLAAGRLKHHPSRAGLAKRYALSGRAEFTGEVRFWEPWLDLPLSWRKPRMVFVCAHGDLFHDAVRVAWIDRVFDVMERANWHTFQVLTKRPERMAAYTIARYFRGARVPSHIWPGTSIESEPYKERRLGALGAVPSERLWVSLEPLLGPLNIRGWVENLAWVVVGGESGRFARPMHPRWPREIRDVCAAAGVPFLFKQWGEWVSLWGDEAWPYVGKGDPEKRLLEGDGWALRVGKKAAGRLLDGREHNEFPAAVAASSQGVLAF